MALAYEANTSLAFDTAALRQWAERYGSLAAELRRMGLDLDRCLSELKEGGWTTPAGTAFYEMTKTNWYENIRRYADMLDMLKQILLRSVDQYEGLLRDHVRNTRVKV